MCSPYGWENIISHHCFASNLNSLYSFDPCKIQPAADLCDGIPIMVELGQVESRQVFHQASINSQSERNQANEAPKLVNTKTFRLW